MTTFRGRPVDSIETLIAFLDAIGGEGAFGLQLRGSNGELRELQGQGCGLVVRSEAS